MARKNLERTPVVERNTPRGALRVSSPEATALELVGYASQCGGLDHVASVLADLVEALDAQKLLHAAVLCPIAWVQRLGYLLDAGGHSDLSERLLPHVKEHAHNVAPLVRSKPTVGAQRLDRWRLAVNVGVAPDL